MNSDYNDFAKKKGRDREKKTELDTCKAWVAQLVINKKIYFCSL